MISLILFFIYIQNNLYIFTMKNNHNFNLFSIKIKKSPYPYSIDINIFKQFFKPKLKEENACSECIKKINDIKPEDNNGFFTEKKAKINYSFSGNLD